VEYLLGNEYSGLNKATFGVLLIAVIRFILGFGFTWAPLQLVSKGFGRRGKPTSDDDNGELGDERDEKLLDSPTGDVRLSEPTITLRKWVVFGLGILIVLLLSLVTLRLMQ